MQCTLEEALELIQRFYASLDPAEDPDKCYKPRRQLFDFLKGYFGSRAKDLILARSVQAQLSENEVLELIAPFFVMMLCERNSADDVMDSLVKRAEYAASISKGFSLAWYCSGKLVKETMDGPGREAMEEFLRRRGLRLVD